VSGLDAFKEYLAIYSVLLRQSAFSSNRSNRWSRNFCVPARKPNLANLLIDLLRPSKEPGLLIFFADHVYKVLFGFPELESESSQNDLELTKGDKVMLLFNLSSLRFEEFRKESNLRIVGSSEFPESGILRKTVACEPYCKVFPIPDPARKSGLTRGS